MIGALELQAQHGTLALMSRKVAGRSGRGGGATFADLRHVDGGRPMGGRRRAAAEGGGGERRQGAAGERRKLAFVVENDDCLSFGGSVLGRALSRSFRVCS